jgi:hypothetical protein
MVAMLGVGLAFVFELVFELGVLSLAAARAFDH